MVKLYAIIALVGVLGIAGYGAKYYYDTTQAEIATLRDNNAKLEVSLKTSEASIETLKAEAVRNAELQQNLQAQLQEAEAYGDNLRKKLRQLDLIGDALRDAANLEGRMNGATAKLWREIMDETGSSDGGSRPLPRWLQSVPKGAGDQSGDAGTESNSTDSGTTKTD
tara:strand:+ start:421 stop:921 length:501 start_codon:yes stop_codon:yes gene_type:complete